MSVRSIDQIRDIERLVAQKTGTPGEKVYAIVNYDNFSILPELLDPYAAMVSRLVETRYSGASRYTTSSFLRMKLGDALSSRDVAPRIYESADEARVRLRDRAQ